MYELLLDKLTVHLGDQVLNQGIPELITNGSSGSLGMAAATDLSCNVLTTAQIILCSPEGELATIGEGEGRKDIILGVTPEELIGQLRNVHADRGEGECGTIPEDSTLDDVVLGERIDPLLLGIDLSHDELQITIIEEFLLTADLAVQAINVPLTEPLHAKEHEQDLELLGIPIVSIFPLKGVIAADGVNELGKLLSRAVVLLEDLKLIPTLGRKIRSPLAVVLVHEVGPGLELTNLVLGDDGSGGILGLDPEVGAVMVPNEEAGSVHVAELQEQLSGTADIPEADGSVIVKDLFIQDLLDLVVDISVGAVNDLPEGAVHIVVGQGEDYPASRSIQVVMREQDVFDRFLIRHN